MAQQLPAALIILRRKQVEARTGLSRSTIYQRIKQGLFVKPVSLGARAVGFPDRDVDALNAARISGKSDADIRVLVQKLEEARRDEGAADAPAIELATAKPRKATATAKIARATATLPEGRGADEQTYQKQASDVASRADIDGTRHE